MKFWLCFVGLLPLLLVLFVGTLVVCLFEGMRRDLLRERAAETAGGSVKREGNNDMILTGLTPVPQPRGCQACGAPEGTLHRRGCVMTLTAAVQPAQEVAATGLEVLQEADEAMRGVAMQEAHRQRLFETDLLLFCLERHTCLTDTERRRLYEVWRNGSVELQVIRRQAAGCTEKVNVRMQAVTVQVVAWRRWRA